MTSEFLVIQWRTLVLDAALKTLVLFLAAGLAALCLRRASAASRHLVWLLTLGGLLALPVLSATLPGWRLSLSPRLLPASWAGRMFPGAAAWHLAAHDLTHAGPIDLQPASPLLAGTRTPVRFAGARARSSGSGSGLAPALRPMSERHSLLRASVPSGILLQESGSWARAAALETLLRLPWDFLLWLGVAALLLARSVVGLAQLGRIRQRCRRVTAAPVLALAAQLARDLDLPRPVTLIHGLIDGPPAVPMTWGFPHPVVLLPTGFAGWPQERQRAVLLHELAHVKRGDWAVQLLSRVTCALYWFHPLVWWATRRLRIESEQACDDRVLTAGVKASDYAAHLLEVVRTTRLSRRSVRAAVFMARGPLVESRLRAILDAHRSRHATPRRGSVLAWLAVAGVLPPLAAVRVSARTPPEPPAALPAAAAAPAVRSCPVHPVRVEIRDITAPPAPSSAAAPSPAPPSPSLLGPPLSPSPPLPPSPPPFPPAPYLGPAAPRVGPAGALASVLPVRVQELVLSPSVVLAVAARSAAVAHAAAAVAARSVAVARPAAAVRSVAVAHAAVAVACRVAAVVALAADAEPSDTRPREPNLSDKDLSGADLSGRDLSGKDLSGKDLSGANLNGANLNGANLSGSDLSGANLKNADLSRARMAHADLSGVDLSGGRLADVDLSGVDLSGANLAHVETSGLTLAHADLSGTNLAGINLAGRDLSGADFSGANLAGARLTDARLTKADLSGANLGDADLSHARLTNADLSGANLNGARLDGADLNGANVSGTKLDHPKTD